MEDEKIISPLRAIRLKCLDCCGGYRSEVANCPITDCSLYPFRFGKNPYRAKREYTDEQKAEIAIRLKAGKTNKEEK